MTNNTIWSTANELLASLNDYRKCNPQVVIESADHLQVEPTLVWVASENEVINRTWSIPLRLFLSTISYVRAESYQDQDDRLNIEHRILLLKKQAGEPKQSAALHVYTTLEVVGYNETRRIDKVMDPNSPDRLLYIAPVSGTTESVIDVRTLDGRIFRIPVDSDIMVAICDTEEIQKRCQRAIEGLKESQ